VRPIFSDLNPIIASVDLVLASRFAGYPKHGVKLSYIGTVHPRLSASASAKAASRRQRHRRQLSGFILEHVNCYAQSILTGSGVILFFPIPSSRSICTFRELHQADSSDFEYGRNKDGTYKLMKDWRSSLWSCNSSYWSRAIGLYTMTSRYGMLFDSVTINPSALNFCSDWSMNCLCYMCLFTPSWCASLDKDHNGGLRATGWMIASARAILSDLSGLSFHCRRPGSQGATALLCRVESETSCKMSTKPRQDEHNAARASIKASPTLF